MASHSSRGSHPLPIYKVAFRRIDHADAGIRRAGLGTQNSHVEIELTAPEAASGVLYALGGFSGGITLFMDRGYLVYEYNMLIIDRFQARSAAPLAAGRHLVTVDTVFASSKSMGPATVVLSVDGREVERLWWRARFPSLSPQAKPLAWGSILVRLSHQIISIAGHFASPVK